MTSIAPCVRVLWIVLLAKPAADAPVQPQSSDALASAAIERGITHMRHDEYEDALREFLAARALSPSPRATAQMGLAEHALGRLPAAERHLTEALAAVDDRWVRARRRDLEASLSEVASRLGTLDIQGFPPGAEIRIEGQLVGALPLRRPLRWPRGSVTVDVSASGYQPFSKAVEVQPGQLVALWAELRDMRPPPPPAAAASAPPPVATAIESRPRSSGSWLTLRRVSWTSLIGGVLAAGVGSALWATGHDKLGPGLVAGGAGGVVAGGAGFILDGSSGPTGTIASRARGMAAPLVTF